MRLLLGLALAAVTLVLVYSWNENAERTVVQRHTQAEEPDRVRRTEPDRGLPTEADVGAVVEGTVYAPDGAAAQTIVYAVVGTVALGVHATDAEGRYRIDVPAGKEIQLLVAPGEGSAWLGQRRVVSLEPDEIRVEDFRLVAGPEVHGVVRMENGRPGPRVQLMAVPSSAWQPHSALLGETFALHAMSDKEGRFVFRAVPPGPYRMLVKSDGWMFTAPVHFRPDDRGVRAVIQPAFDLDLSVHNIETQGPIAAFSITVRFGDKSRSFEGKQGRLVVRIPHPLGARVAKRSLTPLVTVSARGYRDKQWYGSGRGVHAMHPVRDPNVRLEFVFDNGAPYEGEPKMMLHGRGNNVRESLTIHRNGPGEYRATLPRGSWMLQFRAGRHNLTQEVDVPAKGMVDVRFVVPLGGTIVLARPAKWRWPVNRATIERKDRDAAARSVALQQGDNVMTDLETGRYTVSLSVYRVRVVDGKRKILVETPWRREVEVVAGNRVRIELPEGP